MQLPITGVQLKSPAAIEKYFTAIPPGIPIPKLLSVGQNRFDGGGIDNLIGCWSYYSKQPGTPEPCNYPSRLNNTVAYFKSALPDSINNRAFIFIENETYQKSLNITSFSPSAIDVKVEVTNPDSLVLLQNNYFRWKATVNGKPTKVYPAYIAFMKVPLKIGVNEVRFSYNTSELLIVNIVSALLWLLFSSIVYSKTFKYARQAINLD
jgi:hypothetical protein